MRSQTTAEADGPRIGGVTCNCVVQTDGGGDEADGADGADDRRGRRSACAAVSRVTSAKMLFAGFAS